MGCPVGIQVQNSKPLQAHAIPLAYLQFPSGGHGFNGCKGPLWEQWKAESLEWLAERGFLSPLQR